MRKKLAISLFILFLVGLCLYPFFVSGEPRISVVYQSMLKTNGVMIATFGASNNGNAPAVSGTRGSVESSANRSATDVAYRSSKLRLEPGETETIQVQLPSVQGKWRLNCSFAHDTLRTRIYDWQWGPNGPGAKANAFVPRFLKGKVMDVVVTSDWIEPITDR